METETIVRSLIPMWRANPKLVASYFRIERVPALRGTELDKFIYPVRFYEESFENKNLRDARHALLQFRPSLLLDLVPGQYCRDVVVLLQNRANIVVRQITHLLSAYRDDRELCKHIMFCLTDSNKDLMKGLPSAISHCSCLPDLFKLPQQGGKKPLFGKFHGNLACDHIDPTMVGDMRAPDLGVWQKYEEQVDHPLGLGSDRVPNWLMRRRNLLVDLSLNDDFSPMEESGTLGPVGDISAGGEMETSEETYTTDGFAVRSMMTSDGYKPVIQIEANAPAKSQFVGLCGDTEFPPRSVSHMQVVSTFGMSGATPVPREFKISGKSHTKLRWFSRSFAWWRGEFIARLSVKMPLGVAGKVKVGIAPFVAGSMNEKYIMGLPGFFWNFDGEDVIYFRVPWNHADFISEVGDFIAHIGICPVGSFIKAANSVDPLVFTLALQPYKCEFYGKTAVIPYTELSAVVRPGTPFSVGPSGGMISILTSNIVPVAAAALVTVTNATGGTAVGTIMSAATTAVATSSVALPGGVFNITAPAPYTSVTALVTFNGNETPIVQASDYSPVEESGEGEVIVPGVLGGLPKTNDGSIFSEVVGRAKVDVTAARTIWTPVRTVSISAAATTSLLNFKLTPRNFGITGNASTYAPSHASQEAERFIFYGPSRKGGVPSFVNVKITSIANAYTNARLLICQVPHGIPPPTTLAVASQYNCTYHELHGAPTEFCTVWLNSSPVALVDSDGTAGTLSVFLVENAFVTGQGTPQFTLWITSSGMEFSAPRIPTALSILA